jgi:hypothetical protein
MLLVTVVNTAGAFAIVMIISVVAGVLAPDSRARWLVPAWLANGIYFFLPSTGLLSETRFLAVREASLQTIPWTQHLTALVYGLDYAAVILLLGIWSFRRLSLSRL